MAFPGNRLRQKQIEIAAAMVTGALNYDFPLTLTEADFTEEELTLGGTYALQATALSASKEYLGQYQYPIDVIRLDLNADYTLSRVEVVVRVPCGEISTLDNAQIWLWWLSGTDTQPAVDADYGQYDVYNAITDSTGNSVPLVTRSACSYDESPTSTSPQYKDRSGNGQHVNSASNAVLVVAQPGRGIEVEGVMAAVGSFAPGLGEWSVIYALDPWTDSRMWYINGSWYMNATNGSGSANIGGSGGVTINSAKEGIRVFSTTRDAGNGLLMLDELSASITGLSAINYDTAAAAPIKRNLGAGYGATVSLTYLLYSAPNIHWHKLLSRVINRTAGTIISHASNAVGVTGQWTTIVFDGLRAGTEVRVFETPHNAIWELDYDGANGTNIGADYVDFDVVTSTTTDRHYIWWTTDPELAGATGHQVTRSGGETDAQLAALACAVIDGLSDISATVTGTVITVTNARDGFTAKPVYHGQEGIVSIEQIGGTATTEVDGIESSTGDTWTAAILVDSPRLVYLAMLSIAYKNIRYATRVTQAELRVPAGALQVEDPVYDNPS